MWLCAVATSCWAWAMGCRGSEIGQSALRLFIFDLLVGIVELRQKLAFCNLVACLYIERDQPATDSKTELDLICRLEDTCTFGAYGQIAAACDRGL